MIPIITHDARNDEARATVPPFSNRYFPIGYPVATGPIIIAPVTVPVKTPLMPENFIRKLLTASLERKFCKIPIITNIAKILIEF
jgi:hypothetical protein